MAFTLNAFNHEEWSRYCLADFGDFADLVTECNMGEDSFSGYGEWFYVPDEALPNNDRVIYFGSWGNDNCPGARHLYPRRDFQHGTIPKMLPNTASGSRNGSPNQSISAKTDRTNDTDPMSVATTPTRKDPT